MMYRTALKHVLTKPVVLTYESKQNISKMGDNLQNYCQWFGFFPMWRTFIIDDHFAAQAAAAPNTIKPDFEFFLDKCETFLQFKNMSNTRADVTMYKLYPKRDIPAAAPAITGVNPQWLVDGFAAAQQNIAVVPGGSYVPRLQPYDEHNADLFMSSNMAEFFSIKKTLRKFIEPGQFVILKAKDNRGHVVSKTKLGMQVTTDTYSTEYRHQRWQGPIWLFRVQGSQVHAVPPPPAVVLPLNNTDLSITMSGFNVEFYIRTKTSSLGAVGTQPKQYTAMMSDILPRFVVANEQNWDVRIPQGDAMDVRNP